MYALITTQDRRGAVGTARAALVHSESRQRVVKRAAAYVRVSTTSKRRRGDALAFDQNPEVQEQPLRDLIAQRGWQLHRIYTDRASGAKDCRPGLDQLILDARRGVAGSHNRPRKRAY